ncbi:MULTISPECIES: HD domain-containing protein [unclassified Sporosarcina]|uniref:HD domain-containing protein n=1 Tax=unclassified Sporosarcina TaxID=2647733 RepID=UPI000C169E0C|nr:MULTISPECIES: HD domain-containing protein [unclassified Sporosarcina]PID07293.1 phosphohydrolase [Sporosarcina sp. P30]PID10489.1 phosphohydrolase [Sporosarcina sp. P31]PID13074.1 phosphohydrolase [Sporosarcina sp. P32b]
MQEMVSKCRSEVEGIYNKFDASHDLDHIDRVMKNAEKILATEPGADELVVRLAVLLHDVEDAKYEEMHEVTTIELLEKIGATQQITENVISAIESVSFSGGNAKDITSIEGAIVRDADRLDAIGAVGIARAFAFGGARGRKLYDQQEEARKDMSVSEYRKKETATVTHFHEKLLLLKNLMVTPKGTCLAEERHEFMVHFLKQLKLEIE